MSRVCVKSGRYALCTAIIMAGFLLLGARLFYLQVLEAETIASEVEAVRKRVVKVEAKRGDILDRHGNLLAGTRSRIEVGVDPHVVDPGQSEALARLAGILDLPLLELTEATARRERVDSNGQRREIRWVPLQVVDEDQYVAVEELAIKGIYGVRRYERYYPGKETAAHVIGYINKEQTPVMGVERTLDYYLRGQSGWRETEVDGRRRELAAFREREVSPRDGMHAQLTLDLYVQSLLESALRELVETVQPEGASLIVSDPKTGEILGLANYPGFDPNTFWEYPIANQRNRAISDLYEPGSTFKIVPVAAALEEGLIDPFTVVDCGQARRVYNGVNIPMPSDHRDLGEVPVWTVVSKSSNRGAAQIGMLLGEDRLYAYARRFGFGQTTGWPLAGEINGSLMPVDRWDGYTISRLPTGYAIGATALQVHQAMSIVANGGIRIRPKLLKSVFDGSPAESIPLDTESRERVLSPETARLMQEMLTRVVSAEGTARRAELPGYAVAGKTGTARKIVDGQYRSDQHVASFSGFFPAPDPQVVITVVVDNAQTSGPAYGGLVAAPVFHQVAQRLIPHLAIRKPENFHPFLVSND